MDVQFVRAFVKGKSGRGGRRGGPGTRTTLPLVLLAMCRRVVEGSVEQLDQAPLCLFYRCVSLLPVISPLSLNVSGGIACLASYQHLTSTQC